MLPYYLQYKTVIIYKPLQNKYFNSFINNQRSKDGIVLTPTSQIIREIINYRNDNINTLSVFLSDQIPAKGDIKYWTTFLNQDTAVFTGCLLYTSDAADEEDSVDLGGRRIIKKKKKKKEKTQPL